MVACQFDRIACCFAALMLATTAWGEECAFRLGAQTHFGQGWPLSDLALARKVGAAGLRDGLSWARTERRPGVFQVARRDRAFLDQATALGMGVTLVFASRNPLHDGGDPPYSPAGRRAFADFVAAAVDQVGGEVRAIEIGNEANGASVTGPAAADRAGAYAALLTELASAVRARHPEMPILGGAAHSVPIGWFRDLGEAGALAALDGIVIHPYRDTPEGIDREIARLREVIAEFGPPKPIHATEFGLETDDARASADYLVKMSTLLAASGVADASWYALRDEEHYRGMGLYDRRGAEKPAARAFGLVTRALAAGCPVRLGDDPLAQVFRFGSDGPIVAWGAGQRLAVEGVVRRADGAGIAAPERLDDRPIVIEGGTVEVGATQVVGDTRYQFGVAPWSYFRRGLDGEETPLGWRDWHWTSYLGDPATPALAVRDGGVTPGRSASVVERFTATEGGTFRVDARWSRPAGAAGDGVRLAIEKNGAVIWGADFAGAELALPDLPVDLAAGDRLDFVVAAGTTAEGDAIRRRLVIARRSEAPR